jgi:TLC ATP/ADP transporter
MIFLKVYVLAAIIFAIAMVYEAVTSDKYKQDDVWHKILVPFIVLFACFILYPLAIAMELEIDTRNYESKA